MHLERTPSGIRVLAPAKINPFLEVLGKRPDGFHELSTLLVPLKLADELWLEPHPAGVDELRLLPVTGKWSSWHGFTGITGDEQNLVYRSIKLLRETAAGKPGVLVRLRKNIPALAGLGGGSSNAAATLWALNEFWNLQLDATRLAELAAELGSDVPFFLLSSAAVGTGRGERLRRVSCRPSRHVVLVQPPVGLSTKEVYQRCRITSVPHGVEEVVAAWKEASLAKLGAVFRNRLQDSAEELTPWVARLRTAFADLGCQAHQLTGSGSVYFGLFSSAKQAQVAARRLSAWVPGWVAVTATG